MAYPPLPSRIGLPSGWRNERPRVPSRPAAASPAPCPGSGCGPCWRMARPALGLLVLLLAALLPVTAPALARPSLAPEEARALVADTTRALLAAIDADREGMKQDPERAYAVVRRIVLPHVDLERISRLVLGKYWRRASPAQRRRFTEAFYRLVVRTYATAVLELEVREIQYLPLRVHREGQEVTVRTLVPRSAGTPVSLNYRLRADAEDWKLVDVTVEGVSLVGTYRASFGSQMRTLGLDGLIRRMEEKLSQG